ncbi:hypothetical protein VITU102760_22525 [Vibrio tubiashii]|uniref:Uncharacterized protein n=1 Tax=Vibrio tubiashii ATCC 19109 TaxID=1051646 RepID=A0ABP2LQ70_9VIBR|nr:MULTISPECIES: hypothetical protein [Gammaproteobacteria]EGU58271.1 hypothetical protein VITU9109_06914 [Vibrio tubiashii ATCC 19109]|tara:strand:+ start:1789 stop:2064 length:276 start_codon:yes stop_codon:yes gene_type:complete
MSDYFLKKHQVEGLLTDGPLNTFASRLAFLIPTILFAVGATAVTFFGVRYTFSQLLGGIGVLLVTASCVPFAFQKQKKAKQTRRNNEESEK